MVEFGKRLREECAHHGPEWARHCIDYGALKRLIEEGEEGAALPKQARHSGAPAALLRFRYALDNEIEKAVLFVLEEQGSIASELDELAIRRARLVKDTCILMSMEPWKKTDARARQAMKELEKVHGSYALAARSVLQFVSFVDLNVTAVRKILKKWDKNAKKKHHLLHNYMSDMHSDRDVDSHLHQLYNDGGLTALVATLRRAFGELHHLEMELLSILERGGDRQAKHRRFKSMPLTAMGGSLGAQGVQISTSAHYSPAPKLLTHEKEPLLQMIQISRDRLKQNTKYIDLVAAQALMFDQDSVEDADQGPPTEMTTAQKISSFLNLASTFLYMTNYYIVAPTCGQYAARVGSTESMAGIVIGMTPNAALIATVLYGWWTNHSYKSAIIFAGTSSVIGNVAYALALKHNSIALVMIGRFFNGFGSARSINRRFIADTFSRRERTAASAAFVTAGALGMACGPALAAILSRLSYSPDGELWTAETSPGWVMLFLWSAFLVSAFLFFEEPDRSHLFGKKTVLELATTSGEKQLLLGDVQSISETESNLKRPLYKNIPVMTTLWIYFILKLVLECLMSSCPSLTKFYFGWTAQSTGMFLAFLGLLMFPANIFVARLSHRFEDRELIQSSLLAILCSIMGFLAYNPLPGAYPVKRYIFFGICIFISVNSLEGPNMSLLSKTIPRSWAKGIFNTGFLATEAGTAARSVGDVWLTLAIECAGIEGMLNSLFAPLMALVLMSLVLTRWHYDELVECDEDDVKSGN
ncbi:hypothetical protein ACHAXT_005669 [Thalassiosira profunda]